MKYGKCSAWWKGFTKDGDCEGCMFMVEKGKCPYLEETTKNEG